MMRAFEKSFNNHSWADRIKILSLSPVAGNNYQWMLKQEGNKYRNQDVYSLKKSLHKKSISYKGKNINVTVGKTAIYPM